MKIMKKLNPKNMKGKVLREQFILNALNIIIAFIFSFALVLYIISINFNLNNFKEYATNMLFLLIFIVPFAILGLLQKYIFGKILLILTNDKLYFFDAFVENKKTNGCINYDEIVDLQYIPSKVGTVSGRPSQIAIKGEDFCVTVPVAEKSHIKIIKQYMSK